MLSVLLVQLNAIWSKFVGKIRESLRGYHNQIIGFCHFIVEEIQDNRLACI